MRKPLVIARQGARPSGLLGELVARIMAKETAAENDIALDLLQLAPADHLIEVGCGHGDTLARAAARAPQGRHAGIDPSWTMHRLAHRRHRALVAEGRLEFRFRGGEALPYPDHAFHKALSVHTIYFWPEPLAQLAELRRVLTPGGRLVLGFRPGEDPDFHATFPAEVYAIRPQADVEALVRQAGFEVVETVGRTLGGKRMSFVVAAAA